MKKLLIGLLALGSISAFASAPQENINEQSLNVLMSNLSRISNGPAKLASAIQTLDGEVIEAKNTCKQINYEGMIPLVECSYSVLKSNSNGNKINETVLKYYVKATKYHDGSVGISADKTFFQVYE
jgi:hypothetical protein